MNENENEQVGNQQLSVERVGIAIGLTRAVLAADFELQTDIVNTVTPLEVIGALAEFVVHLTGVVLGNEQGVDAKTVSHTEIDAQLAEWQTILPDAMGAANG
jgi:hypothetical protein